MWISLLIGVLLGYIILLLPVILILFSKSVSGKTKVKWVLSVLLIPFFLKIITQSFVMLQGDALQINSFIILGGWAPIIPLVGYISSWGIYLYFKIKYKTPQRKKITKRIAGILLLILLIGCLIFAFNKYKEQEAKTILQCGSEKLFTKNLEPKKLYSTLNFISNKSSSYIGILDGNNIILDNQDNNKVVRHCLKYANNFKIIYPEDSKYNKYWSWEKEIYNVNSNLLFKSEESICVKNKKGYDEHLVWKLQYADNSVKTNRDSFVFEIDKTEHIVKAETSEFSQHFMGIPYSTDENKYIFRPSINDLSEIIIWKFTKDGVFIKEIHVKLPNNMVMELSKGYYISHISIDKNKIQFRLYESYRGNEKQKWENLCSYYLLEIDNEL